MQIWLKVAVITDGGTKMRNLMIFIVSVCLISLVMIAPKHSYAEISDSDIIALWTFDKGNGKEAIDITGHGHDGTFDLGATVGIGKVGLGAELDGKKGQVITVENADPLNVTEELSIVAWVKWNKGGIVHGEPRQWPMIVSKIPINAAYLLFLDTGDAPNPAKPSIAFRMKGPGTVYSKVTVKDDTWYHAAGTYDGKSIKIYINGDLSNEIAAAAPIATTNDVLTIGANKGGTSNRFDGIIDEIGIFGRALTPDEVKQTMGGFDKMLAVKPNGKLAAAWGLLKYR